MYGEVRHTTINTKQQGAHQRRGHQISSRSCGPRAYREPQKLRSSDYRGDLQGTEQHVSDMHLACCDRHSLVINANSS